MESFDDDFDEQEEDDTQGEFWKPIYKLSDELRQHIKKISVTLQSMLDITGDEDKLTKSQIEMMLCDSWLVDAKLAGARGGDMYLLYMENASIIRSHMRQMQSFTYGLEMENEHGDDTGISQPYILVLREEIEAFKDVFQKWVQTFEKDKHEDEWGLY
ncbi:MAG: hypothetical protein IPP77_12300 [Bacteroidetes bacterium]|nr:hypothetical protein [Bacteroidota bacterium]